MKRFVILAIGIWAIAVFLYPGSNYKMTGDLSVPADQVFESSVISWGGTIGIRGNLNGSVILIGGRMELAGGMEGDAICVAADVDILRTAVIKGDLLVIGGTLHRHPESTVKGEYFNLKFDFKKIETTLLPILSDSRTQEFLKAVKIILWFIITLIVFAVVPAKVIAAEKIFAAHIVKTGFIGILSLVIFLFSLFIFIILCFVLIGIPLLFLLVILYVTVCVFGRTVMFYFIGVEFSRRFHLKRITPALFIVIGVIFYALLKFLPVLGPIILIIMSIFEVGIGAGFLLRKKLRLERGID